MSQQINLFNPIFRKQGFSFTSATAMLYGVGIVVATAVAVAAYQDYQLQEVARQAQVIDQDHQNATAVHDKLTADLTRQKPNAQLEAEVAALAGQLQGRQEIIDTLKSGAVGNTDGFSEYMRAFSRQNIDGLWLTGFDIAMAGNELAIQGRTLSAELVASYLTQLNREKSLQGRQFAALRISQPPPEPVVIAKTESEQKADKNAPGQKDAKERKPVLPRYLEFTISTIDIPESQSPLGKSAATEMPLLGTIDAATVLDAAKASARQEVAE